MTAAHSPPEQPATEPCARRVFVHIGGYYPLAPEVNQRRFQREYERSLKTWALDGAFGPRTDGPDWSTWTIRTQGKGWSSEVEHILFRWEDIIEADRDHGWLSRVGLGLLTFADFALNGAMSGYFRHAWRYAGFFLYPFVLLGLIYGAALWISRRAMQLVGFAPDWLVASGLAILLFFALLHVIGAPLKLDHLLDDWNYGRRIVRDGDPAVEERLSRLADRLNDEPREVLIVGHSFGAVWGAALIAMMVARRPEGAPVRFASVGASILKIGFNAAARPLRLALAAIAAAPRVIWHDFTALNDVMNFHMVEPLAALGIAGRPPHVRKVRFRAMVAPEYYARMERNFFRLHNQFISGNDARASYDYFMLMCAPWPMEAQSLSPEGVIPWVDAAGGLTEQGRRIAFTEDAAP